MMIKSAVIFHGTKGSPTHNWFPWLSNLLQSSGYQVTVPKLPTPVNQSLTSWFEAVNHLVFDEETVLVAHSCGATFALHLLENLKVRIKKVILVSVVIDKIGIDEYDILNSSFIRSSHDWKKIQQNCQSVHILHGSNDSYVPLHQAEFVADNLGVLVQIIPDGGHLNAESGFTEFPCIASLIV
jgi:predicted alpha/beta hydrolase family esterase